MNTTTTTTTATRNCGRCGGSGHISAFSHIWAGMCFECEGTGTPVRKARKPQGPPVALKARKAEAVRLGFAYIEAARAANNGKYPGEPHGVVDHAAELTAGMPAPRRVFDEKGVTRLAVVLAWMAANR